MTGHGANFKINDTAAIPQVHRFSRSVRKSQRVIKDLFDTATKTVVGAFQQTIGIADKKVEEAVKRETGNSMVLKLEMDELRKEERRLRQ